MREESQESRNKENQRDEIEGEKTVTKASREKENIKARKQDQEPEKGREIVVVHRLFTLIDETKWFENKHKQEMKRNR